MPVAAESIVVNDVHSRLNPTRVAEILRPRDIDELVAAVRLASERCMPASTCGGRHAMGGQQFASDAILIDTTALAAVHCFDAAAGLIEIEAGADWPAIIRATHDQQSPAPPMWAIRQKQTGADCLTLGGAVSANVHGRGLLMKPLLDDIESLKVVTADGQFLNCSRSTNSELFSLVAVVRGPLTARKTSVPKPARARSVSAIFQFRSGIVP
jgi:FAD/FMN-containing dehydrogenase